jgi:hypothetical protein
LTFTEADDGRLLLYCHRGCTTDEILAAVNLRPYELFYYPGGAVRQTVSGPASPRPDISEEQRAKLDYVHQRALDAIEAEPGRLVELADLLGVEIESLRRLDVGWREDVALAGEKWVFTGDWAWIFPEVNGKEEVVGLLRRYADPARAKRLVAGGRRGLTVPAGWRKIPGPVYAVEGASDVAALLSVGLCAIGRPNNRGGADDLAELLADDPREVVVFGERDRRPDGAWPGDPKPFAQRLSRLLGRPVRAQLPPPPCKDIREFIGSRLGATGREE